MAFVRVLSSPASLRSTERSGDYSASRQPSEAYRLKVLQPRLVIQRQLPALHDPFEVPSSPSPHKSSSIWRSPSITDRSPLPPLAKGANRHRLPSWTGETRVVARTSGGNRPASRALCDPDLAESYGRKTLGDEPWPREVFRVADFGSSGYLSPSDWAALVTRLKAELGTASGSFQFSFASADTSMDGRVDIEEWEAFAHAMGEHFSQRRCRIASMRYLGTRKAEMRRRVKNIFMFDGYDQDASLRLLMACSKWNSSSLLDNVCSALDAKADPNAGLADSRFNDYTPLIFLAMAQPTADGAQVALAIDALVNARADVHRESGEMPFGRLLPLRFAARLQNRLGLEALLRHVDVGDRFSWAAGENVEHVMLDELRKVYGESTCHRVAARSRYSTQATVLLRLFASPIVGGKLTPDGAQKLLDGQFADGNIELGSKADPNGPGLEGMTALMEVVKKGDLDTTLALLKGKATPCQQDSSGATPLHFAAAQVLPDIARALLDFKAEPSMLDQAGFTAWMVAGEAFEAIGQAGDDPKQRSCLEKIPYAPAEYSELMELLKPRWSPDFLLDQVDAGGWEALYALVGEDKSDQEELTKQLRLRESLFFDPRVVVRGPSEARFPRKRQLMRVKDLILDLLQTDPLTGKKKVLTKYLLFATMGPSGDVSCGHVRTKWSVKDNRCAYRRELMEAVRVQMSKFADECNDFRAEIERTASIEKRCELQASDGEISPTPVLSSGQGSSMLKVPPRDPEASAPGSPSESRDPSGMLTPISASGEPPATPSVELVPPQPLPGGAACLELVAMPADEVDVPTSWQEADEYWKAVQKRQVLRYDPPWARLVSSGASCSLQLLRLGAVADLAECSALRQVHHASMEEQMARGYVAYSELCNTPFQDRMKEIAAHVAEREGLDVKARRLDVQPPDHIVPPKRLKRLMEKTREARGERGDLQWPGLSEDYIRISYCFHILDTVRTAFVCGGDTLAEQVDCCMRLVKGFGACTPEEDGLCVMRRKSGFASGVKGSGGYADVKLLVYADLGVHKAFDDVEVPLKIVGEVQIILRKYFEVKLRMHLVYEVDRGSFDRTPRSERSDGSTAKETAHRAVRKLARMGMLSKDPPAPLRPDPAVVESRLQTADSHVEEPAAAPRVPQVVDTLKELQEVAREAAPLPKARSTLADRHVAGALTSTMPALPAQRRATAI